MTERSAGCRGRSALALCGALLLIAACATSGEAPTPRDPVANGHGLPGQEPPSAADLGEATWWLTFDGAGGGEELEEFDDASGHEHVGRLETANGGRPALTPGPEGRGDALLFPDKCTSPGECAMALVAVEHDAALEPGSADFSFGASVKVTADQTTTGSNIVQKGRYGTVGGQWKLQVDTLEGHPSCVVRGADQRLTVRSPTPLADGEWHRVTCSKDASGVAITVDGSTRHKAGAVGAVSNGSEVQVGSSGLTAGDDQFHGAVDDVFLKIEAPPGA